MIDQEPEIELKRDPSHHSTTIHDRETRRVLEGLPYEHADPDRGI
jgi:hypothetical protein